GVLPTGSGSLPLGRLVRPPVPERPDSHLRQLQRGRDLGVFVSPPPDPRAAPQLREDCRPGRRPPPSRSPQLPQGARQPSGSQQCRHASTRPDVADPSACVTLPVPVVPAVGTRRALV